MAENPNCSACNGILYLKYQKESIDGKVYKIYSCADCSQWQLLPIPSKEYLETLYQRQYFYQRKERGYNNYESQKIQKSITNTFCKNLKQLGFYDWEKSISSISKKALEVGCAGGYFIEYLQNRNWDAEGIDVSEDMVRFAQKRNLNVQKKDFLKETYQNNSYDLIVLWATLEHLRDPSLFIDKFARLIKPSGRIYISTCHIGYWAKHRGINWRYLNVPEHIWFFSKKSIEKWFSRYSLILHKSFTYGSGYTYIENAPLRYKIQKKVVDFLAKFFHSGDMIVCDFRKSGIK